MQAGVDTGDVELPEDYPNGSLFIYGPMQNNQLLHALLNHVPRKEIAIVKDGGSTLSKDGGYTLRTAIFEYGDLFSWDVVV